jgi:hypothetical protein
VPAASAALARRAALFVEALRGQGLAKPPGIAETIDWVDALTALDHDELSPDVAGRTLGVLVKRHEDLQAVHDTGLAVLLDRAGEEA